MRILLDRLNSFYQKESFSIYELKNECAENEHLYNHEHVDEAPIDRSKIQINNRTDLYESFVTKFVTVSFL